MYVYSEYDISTSIESIDWHFPLISAPWRARALKVVEETQELLVVNKPSSLPIHPCGSYRSCLSFLEEDSPNIHHHHYETPAFFRIISGVLWSWSCCKGFNSLIAILRNQETVEARMMPKCNYDVQEVAMGKLPGNCHLAYNSSSWAWFEYLASTKHRVDRNSGNLCPP